MWSCVTADCKGNFIFYAYDNDRLVPKTQVNPKASSGSNATSNLTTAYVYDPDGELLHIDSPLLQRGEDDSVYPQQISMNAYGQTICLNMIVKNEAPVIRRCLASVRPFIDHWLIADTGSTDGTQAVIREAFKDLPGELIERPWVDFAHNRTEALDAARGRCDYTLVIDADETLWCVEGFAMPRLEADWYNIEIDSNKVIYLRRQLLRSSLPWRFIGVLHEYAHCDGAQTEATLPGLRTIVSFDGARSRDPLKFRRDALVLEKALLDEPDNDRHVFYLAQCYRDAGELEVALRHYRRRVEMGRWVEEVWNSLYQIALLLGRLNKPWPEVEVAFLEAYQYQPDRAEPLFQIGMHYQAKRQHHTAKLFFGPAMRLPTPPGNRLLVESAIYDYLARIEYAVACFYTGDYAEATEVNDRLLTSGKLPPPIVELVTRNRGYSSEARASASV